MTPFFSIPNLVNQNLLLQLTEVVEEALKQVDCMFDVMRTGSLTDAVHAQLRVTQIQRPRAHLRGEHRTNGATAAAVVPDNEELQWDTSARGRVDVGGRLLRAACRFLEDDDAGGVGGVAGVGINFDDRALVHLRPMARLILARIVGVYGVGHIGGDKEGSGQGLFECGGGVDVDFVVGLVAVGLRRRENRQTTDHCG